MNKHIADLLQAEAEHAETHADAPLRDGTTITHRGRTRHVLASIGRAVTR